MANRPNWMVSRRKDSQDVRQPQIPSARNKLGRKPLVALFLAGAAVTAGLFYYNQIPAPEVSWHSDHHGTPPLPLKLDTPPPVSAYHASRSLKGPPTESFRDNLLPDVQYVTGWLGGGHTNDFMTYIDLIYVGILTRRVPILGPFAPTHVGTSNQAGFIPFGDIYDIERLSREINLPIVEWRDVKKPYNQGDRLEGIGGWSVWARYDNLRSGLPRGNHIVNHIGLDVSYTNAPARAKIMKDEPGDAHVSFLEIARLSTPSAREETIRTEAAPFRSEGGLDLSIPPDEHLMVFDFLYFTGMLRNWEWGMEYFEPWRIASHAHWKPKMKALVQGYLVRLFEIEAVYELPRFISVHVRHGDFENMCEVPVAECFAPLSAFVTRVKEVQDELATRSEYRNADGTPIVLPVVMTSDDRDPKWWAEVSALGWLYIDHGPEGEDTTSKYGRWYPLLIDAVIQSMGHGFVGTDRSTMSVVAARRVEDWQRGATRMVVWGLKGADDHPPQTKNQRTFVENRNY